MELILNLSLFILTFLGGMLPIIVPSWNKKYASNLLIFSGAFLFAVCIGHILPEAFHAGHNLNVGALVVGGFFFQFILQRLTHGIEHGHDCEHHHNDATAWSLFGGMAIHSFIEGLPLSTGFFKMETLIPLYTAIVLHKIPMAIIIISLFSKKGQIPKTKSFLILALFAMITPMAAGIGYWVNYNIPGFQEALHWVIPIIAGSFLQIATTIFYESANGHHKIDRIKWVMIIIGVLLGIVSGLGHTH